jgi:ankyrin repeat protein
MYAAENGKVETVELLLSKGANIEAASKVIISK